MLPRAVEIFGYWVIFDNSSAKTAAAEKFLIWLTAPAQVKSFSEATGDLPTRESVANAAGFTDKMNATLPGVSTFISNLANVKQARPQIIQYPKISTILGNMVNSVLLGKAQPQAALNSAAKQVNQVLAGS